MKVLTVVGARPQFIKAAPVSLALRKVAQEVLVHTGQHFDENMSGVFFAELNLPEPDYNLGISGASHGAMTGAMLIELEKVLLEEKPDKVLVYGDTNSTLAGALAASKLQIPVAHVEAGLRSYNRKMPEEINRVLVDHLSGWLFAPTQTAVDNLAKEGIGGVQLVGDVMYDALLAFLPRAQACRAIFEGLELDAKGYALLTVHRAENTDDPAILKNILEAVEKLDLPLIWPLHPRTRKNLRAFGLKIPSNVKSIDPVGYLAMLLLESEARVVLTDSGGVQKEAAMLGTPCITLREETEWVETVQSGWNILAGTAPSRITAALEASARPENSLIFFGKGDASQKIVEALIK